ncbi:type-F conjugative transfer system secretin TraK [Azospirillum sp. SYSU D00513]|uniref:TraK domain-containing protein n=1 Tax=Azospirillum sp. SYSU D00513 TaxID=2812561 RepID=UPI001A97928F|nr:type-F conjugative transfer system secretin TraK [Azospirillum sp. SYSU D00513]
MPAHRILSGVSAVAVIIGLSGGVLAQTSTINLASDLPVTAVSDIEAEYQKKAAPETELETLRKALQSEMQERAKSAPAAQAPAATDSAGRVNQAVQQNEAAAGAAKVQPAAMSAPTVAAPAVQRAAAPPPAPPANVELPAVPAAVMRPGEVPADDAALALPALISMKPGTTELVAVAEGHLNRIVTPFAEPSVVTTSDAKTRISGNVVYVSTTSPATIYITPKGDESVALPLALVPRRIPPREIKLEMSQSAGWGLTYASMGGGSVGGAYAARNKKAEKWEENQPYVETLRAIFRDVALGKVPSGYQMREVGAREAVPHCDAPGGVSFRFDGGQVLQGGHLDVAIGIVTNKTGQTIELSEPWCAGADVAGVAFWPANVLQPGQSTEVFVVRRPMQETDTDTRRPSLLVNARGQ